MTFHRYGKPRLDRNPTAVWAKDEAGLLVRHVLIPALILFAAALTVPLLIVAFGG